MIGDNFYLPIPRGIFYSEKKDNSHTGYLRLLPVSLENDFNACDDYRDLVQVRLVGAFYVAITTKQELL